MSHDTVPSTVHRDVNMDGVTATLRARFANEVALVSNLSDGSSPDTQPPPPPVAASEVPLIRPISASGSLVGTFDARTLNTEIAAVSRYVREETTRVTSFAEKLERSVPNTGTAQTLQPWLCAVDALAQRLTLAGDVLEHAIESVERNVSVYTQYTAPNNTTSGCLRGLERLRVAFEPAVLSVSAAYAEVRTKSDTGTGETRDGVWRPPDAFERKTTKYWVELKDVLELKLAITKHLPVLVYTPEEAKERKDEEQNIKKKSPSRDGQGVTSVYLDSNDCSVYDSRLVREQGATLVRARWYVDSYHDRFDNDGGSLAKKEAVLEGANFSTKTSDVVFVERKTHHESWSRDGSTKERFSIPRQALQPFLTGSLDMDNAFPVTVAKRDATSSTQRARRLAEEISRFEIHGKRVAPSVRTEYRRVAFQRSNDNAVRVSLDVDLTFSDARGTRGDERDGRVINSRNVTFPYAILEIKTRDETPPDWVEKVLTSIPVVEVRKFSKFLHASMLFRGGGDLGDLALGDCIRKQSGQLLRAPHWWCFDDATGADRGVAHQELGTGSNTTLNAHTITKDHVTVTVCGESPDEDNNSSDTNSGGSNTPPSNGSSGISGLTRAECGVLDRFLAENALPTVGSESSWANGTGGSDIINLLQDRPNDLTNDRSKYSPLKVKTCFFPFKPHSSPTQGTAQKRFVPVKVEPKTFFANERTLLQWLSMSVLLLFAALALLSLDQGNAQGQAFGGTGFIQPTGVSVTESAAADAQGFSTSSTSSSLQKHSNATFLGGAILAPVSVLFMAYALWTYLWRARRIARREPSARYDDIVGPTVLVVVLVVVSAIAVVVAIDARA